MANRDQILYIYVASLGWDVYVCVRGGGRGRLHDILGLIGSKLWFPWQQKPVFKFFEQIPLKLVAMETESSH